jgi:hypothetical protein
MGVESLTKTRIRVIGGDGEAVQQEVEQLAVAG